MNWLFISHLMMVARTSLHTQRAACMMLVVALLSTGIASAQTVELSSAEQLLTAVPAANDPPQSFRVLCYHDIRDNLQETFKTQPEATAVDTIELIRHFSWLKENGYHPVSLQQIIDARAGHGTLPDKAILLTFDDGYKSVFTKVFPLLKLFNFPAVIAIVGDWIETPPNEQVLFGDKLLARDQFANWEDIRTMVASGLVEVASHTNNLHKGIMANPQGNSFPAAISRYYRPQNSSYESNDEYSERIQLDLQRNSELIEHQLHKMPRAMVWPYGRYNQETTQLAAKMGMPITMNLDSGPNTPDQPLARMRRTLINFNTGVAELIQMLHEPAGYTGRQVPIERVIHLDLDYIYDPNPVQQEINLSRVLDRIKRLHPTTVYLQAFADPDGDGVADEVYFPNRHLPMRADLFSRVAWQLSTRVGVKVYAWMPVMAFRLPESDPAASHIVQVMPDAPSTASQNRYHRLSIFDPLVRKTILEIYEDLGKSAIFDGVLFHDDATLSDYEDANPAALDYYREAWQLPDSIKEIRKSPELRLRWAANKTAYINAFTVTLADTLHRYQPNLHTARNLYAQPVLNPESEEWYAQSLPSFLATYDFVSLMAMPYMEGAADPERWLDQLLQKVHAVPGALDKTIFELQSRDWKTSQPIPSETLAAQMRWLHLNGVRNFGYYPDDFQANVPQEDIIKPVISVETNVPVR
ncbi:poly-beta-1,6-N-acetyl-D-glucosamine N-deacetylase PgaB [Solimicrobium silvestre]|uniref:Poly-beta-1,6-N-acetyl-D-glucosamine N-deacetylase PgaB n=1 Tax=Solimicrobium silvestre TaxID=2099400 RepID=A0A2S9GS96_9BURK|nr:poly-beta-1,6-N-acetyl-D-glucosamine N-deacetylase PgaB [Solimicrobium silvestre]PRC90602.1 Poly-beta-1,6-N-acetyl-D-glucosamine N-deacetylase PgaB [Solimicrobium silvestre]